MDLEGKHVVIIGGSSGMGLATEAGAAAAGAKVTIASSDQSRLDAALAALPGGCDGVVVDVRVHTPMWDAVPEPQRSALLGAQAERTITKTVGEPGDIAAAHLYLMGNRFVTGTVLTVDGGAVLL